jgi:hypothetical protein
MIWSASSLLSRPELSTGTRRPIRLPLWGDASRSCCLASHAFQPRPARHVAAPHPERAMPRCSFSELKVGGEQELGRVTASTGSWWKSRGLQPAESREPRG